MSGPVNRKEKWRPIVCAMEAVQLTLRRIKYGTASTSKDSEMSGRASASIWRGVKSMRGRLVSRRGGQHFFLSRIRSGEDARRGRGRLASAWRARR